MMNSLIETFEAWLRREIREITDQRVVKLDERLEALVELTQRIQRLEAGAKEISEFRVEEIVQNQLCNVDWGDMIGEEVSNIVDAKISDLNLDDVPDEDAVRDWAREVINNTEFTVQVGRW